MTEPEPESREVVRRTDQGLVDRPRSLAQRGLDALRGLQPRTFTFPPEFAGGHVSIGSDGEHWEYLQPSEGTLTLRPGQRYQLFGAAVTDAGLAQLRHLTGLSSLSLIGTGITDVGVAHLGQLTGLTWLSLAGGAFTDAGLAHLTRLTDLQSLSLIGSVITDTALTHVEHLTRLTRLSLLGATITDAGLAHLEPLTFLTDLALGSAGITDAGLTQLVEHHSGLTNLSLVDARITDAGLAYLRHLPYLATLMLDDATISDAGLAHLAHLKNLMVLSLTGTGITDAGLIHLRPLTGLKALWLDNTAVTDDGLVHLQRLTHLEDLNVERTGLTNDGLTWLTKKLPATRIASQPKVGYFAPDYGLRLITDGYPSDVVVNFYEYRIFSVDIVGLNHYTTTANISYEGEEHALTLDFDNYQLDQILSKASPGLAQFVRSDLTRDPATPRSIRFEEYVSFGVSARLGKVEKGLYESFVPLVAKKIW